MLATALKYDGEEMRILNDDAILAVVDDPKQSFEGNGMNEERNDEDFKEIEITEGDQPEASADESADDGVGAVEGVETSEAGENQNARQKSRNA